MDHYQLNFKHDQDNDKKRLDQRIQGIKIDDTITELLQEHQAEKVNDYDLPKGLGDLIKGDLVPVNITQYEIKEEGVVEVVKAYPLDSYAAAVILLGFNSQSEFYQQWVSTLQNLGFKLKEQRPQLEELYRYLEAKGSG